MKYLRIKILSILLALTCLSCENDLTEELKGSLSASTLVSESDARALVDGIYNQMLTGGWFYYGSGQMVKLNDGITDVMVEGRTSNLEQYHWTESHADMVWSSAYVLINRANTALELIEGMDESSFASADAKAALMGEALFLRSLAYFDLTGLFGAVPLRLGATSDPGELPSRTPEGEVYAQLISDLETAAEDLPPVQDGVGKATRGAALTLLAKIAFRQKEWSSAEGYIDQVIDLGVYDLFEGQYGALFYESNRKDNEFIFVVMSLGAEYNKSNHHIKFFTPWGYDTGWSETGVPLQIYNMLDPSDARNDVIENDLSGAYYAYVRDYGTAADWKGFALLTKYSGFRRDVTAPNSIWANYASSALNQPVFRYADILLMKAEVENELNGPTGVAYNAINAVRNRAGLEGLPTGFDQGAFRTAILNERALELVGEGHRKDDLIRHGVFESTMTQYLVDQNYPNPVTVTQDYRVYPIPRQELDLNPNMEPNPLNK